MSASPLDEALALLRDGRVADAEEMMKRAVREVAEKHGEHSAAWAAAQSDMGNVLLRADQPAWAAECFRAAVTMPVPPGEDPQRRLGYQLNLGIALALSGRLEEAADALRKSCARRLAFFGRKHAGYALGLEPLADVLLRLGDHKGALEAIDKALAIFQRTGHERLAGAVALRGVILQADGWTTPLFPALADLPDHLVERVATIAATRVRRDVDPASAQLLLAQLATAVRDRLGPDHAATLGAFTALAERAGERGDHAGRTAALRRVLASYDRQDRALDALAAATSIAEALGEAGETDKSLTRYEDAAARAERIGQAGRISQAQFDWGLALLNADRLEPAAERLGEAVTAARAGDDPELLGSVAAAYGICLQHLGRPADARHALEDALSVLEPRHDAAHAARAHLVALLDSQDCGCAGMKAAAEEAYRDFVMSRMPDGLLVRFDVRIVGNNFKFDFELQRELVEEEARQFDEIVRAGHAEFSRQVAG
jgi:tetratricopeptide (TPR) repeat protein